MPRSENYSTDSVQSFKSNFREHLPAHTQNNDLPIEMPTVEHSLQTFPLAHQWLPD